MGKLVRSCGDCSSNGGPRYDNINNTITGNASAGVVDINSNYGDKATIRTLTLPKGTKVCVTYKDVSNHKGSSAKIGEEFGTKARDVSQSDVTYK